MASIGRAAPPGGARRSGGSRTATAGAAAVRGGAAGALRAPADGDALSRERVGDLQRARILSAMTELVRERGAGDVTVAHIVGRSGVSRRTFYELFEDREGCLLAAFDHAAAQAAAVVLPTYTAARRGGSRWEEQLRAGLGALLGFLDEQPAMGGLLVVDSLGAEHRVLARRADVLEQLVNAVHRGARAHALAAACEAAASGGTGAPTRPHSRGRGAAQGRAAARNGNRGGGAAPRIVAEGAVGAVLAVIHARLLKRGPQPLRALLNPLMAMLVLPYLGTDAAERELERPTPRVRRRAQTTETRCANSTCA